MPTPTWTPADQQALEQLVSRKALHENTYRMPVYVFFRDNFPWNASTVEKDRVRMSEKVVDFMIKNADTIRDLLKPFDSGVRPAVAEEKA
jgi:hypothetical protein